MPFPRAKSRIWTWVSDTISRPYMLWEKSKCRSELRKKLYVTQIQFLSWVKLVLLFLDWWLTKAKDPSRPYFLSWLGVENWLIYAFFMWKAEKCKQPCPVFELRWNDSISYTGNLSAKRAFYTDGMGWHCIRSSNPFLLRWSLRFSLWLLRLSASYVE